MRKGYGGFLRRVKYDLSQRKGRYKNDMPVSMRQRRPYQVM